MSDIWGTFVKRQFPRPLCPLLRHCRRRCVPQAWGISAIYPTQWEQNRGSTLKESGRPTPAKTSRRAAGAQRKREGGTAVPSVKDTGPRMSGRMQGERACRPPAWIDVGETRHAPSDGASAPESWAATEDGPPNIRAHSPHSRAKPLRFFFPFPSPPLREISPCATRLMMHLSHMRIRGRSGSNPFEDSWKRRPQAVRLAIGGAKADPIPPFKTPPSRHRDEAALL